MEGEFLKIETRMFSEEDYNRLYKNVGDILPVGECFTINNTHFYCQKEKHVLHILKGKLVNILDARHLVYELKQEPEKYVKIDLKEFDNVLIETLTNFYD